VSDPSRDWLLPQNGFLNTSRGREKVRAWFRRSAHEANLAAGRAMLERELKRLALADADPDKLLARLHLKTHDELLVALALGEVTGGQISRMLQEPTAAEVTRSAGPIVRPPASGHGELSIQGVGNLLNTLARCCQPLPGDAVRGFITRGRGVSVHRADCASLARLARRDPDRVLDVDWGHVPERAYEVDIDIRGYDRKGLQKDITGVITAAGTPIVASASRVDTRSAEVGMQFTLRVRDYEQLSALLSRLEALPNVIDVRRLAG
jgi:GTP pyrophosphokinase